MLQTGVSYRYPMAVWIDSRPPGIDFLEIPSEIFLRPEMANRLAMLKAAYPLAVRSTALSLGTPCPLGDEILEPIARLARATNARWLSEPVGFSRTAETDLHHFCPVPPTEESIAVIADHAAEISARCGCQVLLENIASPLRFESPISEPDFLVRLCDRSGCGLLLDVTALYVNSRNHGFDPVGWLERIDPAHIAQIHVAGYCRADGRWEDRHDAPIQDEVRDLAAAVVARCPDAGAILEHDTDIPPVDTLEEELAILRHMGAPR